jgi:hypothetical protein
MIKDLNFEVSEDILDEVIMTALETQFKDTSLCLNKKEYELHRRTEILLGRYYHKIMNRNKEQNLKQAK